ncbi:Crp/Fnr family transcriptional regulator [Labrenzia sp. PHM005]|uniref:Crp/Fnr family transcriptional regulator n=1 Tax=Labrenzia sp. PHM005 TaxID=2590016 RepID=UPI00143DD11F|nr:Crp/Fnr family transcriptional regulator [Labrenzia sp. PHM005]
MTASYAIEPCSGTSGNTGKNPDCCAYCHRRKETEWCDLGARELEILSSSKHSRIYEAGELLYQQGDDCNGVFCIRDGIVGDRRVDADGNSVLVRLNYGATTLGYQEFLTKTEYRNTAEILQDSFVCFIHRSVISQLLSSDSALGERFLRRSIRDTQKLEDNYVVAMNASIRSRLLHVLLVLYERNGKIDTADRHVLEIPIARADLASLVGTGPETISRTIRKLQQDRLVEFDGRTAFIRNLDAVYNEIVALN